MIKRILSIILFCIVSNLAIAQVKVAILPVADKSGEIKYAVKLMLTASLTSAISMTEGYEAYDRIDLSSILDEQSFQRTGLVSDSDIHKIGEMTGASYVLVTEAASIDDTHLFATSKIVNVESARIGSSAVSMIDIANTEKMLIDCKSLTDRLLLTQIKESTPSDSQLYHRYVDLGLSVKWAECNLGASKPEEAGDYYAWGETNTKESYDWSSYKWCSAVKQDGEPKSFSKYILDKEYGRLDNKATMDISDDAARSVLGSGWRIPSDKEWEELNTYCRWELMTIGDVIGFKVTSNLNGNSIFLPAVEYKVMNRVSRMRNANGPTRHGIYWSSTLRTTGYMATCFWMEIEEQRHHTYGFRRSYGVPIRPVIP